MAINLAVDATYFGEKMRPYLLLSCLLLSACATLPWGSTGRYIYGGNHGGYYRHVGHDYHDLMEREYEYQRESMERQYEMEREEYEYQEEMNREAYQHQEELARENHKHEEELRKERNKYQDKMRKEMYKN